MRFQTQQSAEFLRPFRQPVLLNAHQRCRVVRHDGHAHVPHCPSMAFVSDVRDFTAERVPFLSAVNLRQGLLCRLAYPWLRMVEEALYVLFGLLGSECTQHCEGVLHHLVVLQ